MNQDRAERRLSGIFIADVVGYSRHMGDDEDWTIQNLEDNKKMMDQLVKEYNGRVVDAPGDNILAEFSSVVNAVECAVKIQQDLKNKYADSPSGKRMEFRIGINLGDVIIKENSIYGDGVNAAARIESLAEPGGICISRPVYDQVKRKVDVQYDYLGDHFVKNLDDPIRIYRIIPEKSPDKTASKEKSLEKASFDKMAYPLPEKPSIVVMPFDNLSGDPDQEYFCDGLTEEIITGLSKNPELFVIARNTSFSYKNKPVKAQQVSEETGVRYILEGSVRKQGKKVRVTVQLIDAVKGYQIWSERYDREMDDIFSLQSEITTKISIELRIKLIDGDIVRRYIDKDTQYYEEWLGFLRYLQEKNYEMAKQSSERLIKIAPNDPEGYYGLGIYHVYQILYERSESPEESLKLAEEYAEKAYKLDKSYGHTRELYAYINLLKENYESAIAYLEEWVDMDPNSAIAQYDLGYFLYLTGEYEKAIQHIERAIRLDPYPDVDFFVYLGAVYSVPFRNRLFDQEKAKEYGQRALKIDPNSLGAHCMLAGVYSTDNEMDKANYHASEVLRIMPNFTLKVYESYMRVQRDKEVLEYKIESLRKVGIPEE
ncbi:MAG: tetratricopeptide repeat protein [Deltaproteobacteria bacterium]|nr:tetratricopeptide repeat protein [Deltaproteobacteria bacterium]